MLVEGRDDYGSAWVVPPLSTSSGPSVDLGPARAGGKKGAPAVQGLAGAALGVAYNSGAWRDLTAGAAAAGGIRVGGAESDAACLARRKK